MLTIFFVKMPEDVFEYLVLNNLIVSESKLHFVARKIGQI